VVSWWLNLNLLTNTSRTINKMTAIASKAPAFNAALSLNNSAIALTQRSCYRQGFDTLKDAVSLLRAPLDDDDIALNTLINLKLNEAMRRLTSSQPSPTSASPCVEVMSHDAADSFSLQDEEDLKKLPTLIRFETSDVDLFQANDQGLPCAIILYNLAVASLLCNMTSAARFLSCALHLLQGRFEQSQDDPFYLRRVIFVSVHALTTLIPTLLDSGKVQQAEESTQDLAYLETVAQTLEESGLFAAASSGLIAAAA
jgi:hypothetical protein